MPSMLPYVHVVHLITELRHAASDSQVEALAQDDGRLSLCLDAALMNDAADALENLLAERVANGPVDKGAGLHDGIRRCEETIKPWPK